MCIRDRDLGLDTDSVVAALLHDSVEDTETTAEDGKAAFGPDVALLVDGVTKLVDVYKRQLSSCAA